MLPATEADLDNPDALTEEFRQQELARGAASFWYFVTAICGLVAADPDTGEPTVGEFHRDLAAFLEGRAPHHPYNRAVVCCARGTGKSVWVRLYALWRMLYIVNFSVLLISNSAENAKKVHFLKLVDLLTSSRRAEYIRWLFSHRFPPGMAGTNSEQIKLIQTDPLADPALTYAGIETALEGKHPDLIIIDDPEGADAEKSSVANRQSYALVQKVIPLPRYPAKSQIIIVGTPWGANPLVYQLRDECNWQHANDNAKSRYKFFWKPIEDDNGNSIWPERFPSWYIDQLRNEPIFGTQFLLKRDSGQKSIFDMEAVAKFAYHWVGPTKDQIVYQGFRFDPEEVSESGYVFPRPEEAVVRLKQLRFFIHHDPLHKSESLRRSSVSSNRPTKSALSVVGVAPDNHCFLIDYSVDDIDLPEQAAEMFRLYRIYMPTAITFEAIGAQVWLKGFVETQERQNPNWARPKSAGLLGPPVQLPRMSTRLIEADKTTQESKEWLIRERLSSYVNHGILHFRTDQETALRQLENVLNEKEAIDLVDSLAQGPPVWKPGASDVAAREFAARRAYVENFVSKGALSRTGYRSPGWRRAS